MHCDIHGETPLNNTLKSEGQEGKTGPVWGWERVKCRG
jgi:hypothetical protein